VSASTLRARFPPTVWRLCTVQKRVLVAAEAHTDSRLTTARQATLLGFRSMLPGAMVPAMLMPVHARSRQ
jgi:hypothetical protein